MSKKLRVISIDFPFADPEVVQAGLDSDWALFDFDVVVIRPRRFNVSSRFDIAACRYFQFVMNKKKRELESFFFQGAVLVVFLDVPNIYRVEADNYGAGRLSGG